MGTSNPERLSLDSRPLREIGNSVGQTFDKSGLEKLGIVNDEGELVDDVEARQTIWSDGRVEIEIDVTD